MTPNYIQDPKTGYMKGSRRKAKQPKPLTLDRGRRKSRLRDLAEDFVLMGEDAVGVARKGWQRGGSAMNRRIALLAVYTIILALSVEDAEGQQQPVVVSDPPGAIVEPQPETQGRPAAKPHGADVASLRVRETKSGRRVEQYACRGDRDPFEARRDLNLGTDQEVVRGEVRCLSDEDREHSVPRDWKRVPEFQLRRKGGR